MIRIVTPWPAHRCISSSHSSTISTFAESDPRARPVCGGSRIVAQESVGGILQRIQQGLGNKAAKRSSSEAIRELSSRGNRLVPESASRSRTRASSTCLARLGDQDHEPAPPRPRHPARHPLPPAHHEGQRPHHPSRPSRRMHSCRLAKTAFHLVLYAQTALSSDCQTQVWRARVQVLPDQ